jgi:hypothetical protein
MARSSGKRAFKAQGAGSRARTVAAATDIPSPFRPVPSSLQPFVSTLPTDHFYITHLDQNAVSVKKQAFLVPSVLNILIVGVLCLRVYYVAPIYLGLILTLFNYETPYHVDPSGASAGDIMSTVASRTFLMMVDYAMFWVLGSWPRQFLLGGASNRFVGPLGWKMNVGFQETEAVVRRGRKWDIAVVEGVDESQRSWDVNDELTIKIKVEAAMRRNYTSKTALSLLDKDWDLDYHAMSDAHHLAEDGKVKLDDLQELGLIYYHKQWLVWHIHEAHEVPLSDLAADEKVRNFREKLKALGCESVFYRWIEIIQYETNQPGGFLEGRQGEAMRELQRMLESKGVDYGGFLGDIGGTKGLPGFD